MNQMSREMTSGMLKFNEIKKNDHHKIKYYHWNQEITIPTRQIDHHIQKPTADQGSANKKLFGVEKHQTNGDLGKIFR